MLQIRLRKPSGESGGATKPLPADNITVACPNHLVLADLAVAKSLGLANTASLLKNVGRRSNRQLGERVHFCVRCDFPIAIYGRLSPCEHAFCLDCARGDSLCYLCDERVQKIQTIKMMEGIFICAAPHCLKSFLKKNEFECHIRENHANLLHPNSVKDGNVSDTANARKPTVSGSTFEAPPRSVFSPSSSSQGNHEGESHHPQIRDHQPHRSSIQSMPTPPYAGQIHDHQAHQEADSTTPLGFERPAPQNQFPQQTFESQGGIVGGLPFNQPHSFAVPMNPNPVLPHPQFGYPHFAPDGAQPIYGASYEVRRPDPTPEGGSEQGSSLDFPSGLAGIYPQPWNMGQVGGHFEPPVVQGSMDSFMNASDTQGRNAFFQGDCRRNSGGFSPNMPPAAPSANRGLEGRQGGYSTDPRDGKGVLVQPTVPLPLPPHLQQLQTGRSCNSDTSRDGQGFGQRDSL